MSHPRRTHVDQLLATLGTIPGVPGGVLEAPVFSLDSRRPDALPAIAVNYRTESLTSESHESDGRTLQLAVVVAGRSQPECDELDNAVEDAVAQLPAWRLRGVEFGLEGPEQGFERHFFVHAHVYELTYVTRRAVEG